MKKNEIESWVKELSNTFDKNQQQYLELVLEEDGEDTGVQLLYMLKCIIELGAGGTGVHAVLYFSTFWVKFPLCKLQFPFFDYEGALECIPPTFGVLPTSLSIVQSKILITVLENLAG